MPTDEERKEFFEDLYGKNNPYSEGGTALAGAPKFDASSLGAATKAANEWGNFQANTRDRIGKAYGNIAPSYINAVQSLEQNAPQEAVNSAGSFLQRYGLDLGDMSGMMGLAKEDSLGRQVQNQYTGSGIRGENIGQQLGLLDINFDPLMTGAKQLSQHSFSNRENYLNAVNDEKTNTNEFRYRRDQLQRQKEADKRARIARTWQIMTSIFGAGSGGLAGLFGGAAGGVAAGGLTSPDSLTYDGNQGSVNDLRLGGGGGGSSISDMLGSGQVSSGMANGSPDLGNINQEALMEYILGSSPMVAGAQAPSDRAGGNLPLSSRLHANKLESNPDEVFGNGGNWE